MSADTKEKTRRPNIRAAALLSIALVCATAVAAAAWDHSKLPPLPEVTDADMGEVAVRNQDIALFEARAKSDPYSAADRSRLASLYFQRSRETGDFEDYRRAEMTARESLALREQRNTGARLILSSSLLAQHRFTDALPVAAELVALEPDKPSVRSLLGEIQLELGDYEAAAKTFRSLHFYRYDLAVAPRYARWAEINGRTAEAGAILQHALDEALTRGDLPREQIAWFYLRSGDFHMRHGELRAAETALRAGLAIEPSDHRLWGMLAQLSAMRGKWQDVIERGERTGERADFNTLSAMADAHARLGDTLAAKKLHALIEANYAETPEPFARQWTQFHLDNDIDLEKTAALLADESARRPDALGFDMLGWGLYKLGRFAEAREASQRALAPGIEDARFFFHAAQIERALGADAAADSLLARAKGVNAELVKRLSER